VIYEAFQSVYKDDIELLYEDKNAQFVGIELFRGKMSGNIKLNVTLYDEKNLVKEMCLFSDNQERSHKVCSEIVHVDSDEGSLAYVISIEKVYGMEDIVVIRLVHVEKMSQNIMSDYSWNPSARP